MKSKFANMLKYLAAALLLAAFLVPATVSASSSDTPFATGQLHNGLRYIIVRSELQGDRIRMGIRVFAGTAYEDADEVSAAHLIEHLLVSYYTDDRGARVNLLEHPVISLATPYRMANTGAFSTKYEFEVRTAELSDALGIMRGIANGTKFSDAEIATQRGVVIAEAIGPDGSEGEAALREMAKYMRRPDIESVNTNSAIRRALMRLDERRIKAFYNKWYRPANEIIYVAGDIDVRAVEAQVRSTFGDIEAKPLPPPPLVSPGSFDYLYYRSTSDRTSKAYIRFGLRGDGLDASPLYSNLLKDALACFDEGMGADREKASTKPYGVAFDTDSFPFEKPAGIQIVITADRSGIALALKDVARQAGHCKASLADPGSSFVFRDAVERAANRKNADFQALSTRLIENSSGFDEPLLRNGLRENGEALGPQSRQELIDRLFSREGMSIAGFDPEAAPSILASPEKLWHVLTAHVRIPPEAAAQPDIVEAAGSTGGRSTSRYTERQIFQDYLKSGMIAACPKVTFGKNESGSVGHETGNAQMLRDETLSPSRKGGEPAARLSRSITYDCALGQSDIASSFMTFMPRAELMAYSSEEKELAQYILDARMFRTLRERDGGTYAPKAELRDDLKDNPPTIIAQFSTLLKDRARIQLSARAEIENLAINGVSDHDVAVACYKFDMALCTAPGTAGRLSRIFAGFKRADISTFSFRN